MLVLFWQCFGSVLVLFWYCVGIVLVSYSPKTAVVVLVIVLQCFVVFCHCFGSGVAVFWYCVDIGFALCWFLM